MPPLWDLTRGTGNYLEIFRSGSHLDMEADVHLAVGLPEVGDHGADSLVSQLQQDLPPLHTQLLSAVNKKKISYAA